MAAPDGCRSVSVAAPRRLSNGAALIAMSLIACLAMTAAAATTAGAVDPGRTRVAIIVGPVGPQLTPTYIDLAQQAALEAERTGAEVARAYSPDATPERVLAAVRGASIVIYFGHGTGFPNPYSATARPAVVNGWALQGPKAHGTHDDSWADGTLAYYGEDWLVAHAKPAPGFVMIYSNACYAPGASEGWLPRPDKAEALAHVANYSRPAFRLGASAYFATDFYGGAARIIAGLLDDRGATFGQIFKADPQYGAGELSRHRHPDVAGVRIWLHRSPYFDGIVDYWYAFAGRPSRQFVPRPRNHLGGVRHSRPSALTGMASSYSSTRGFADRPTVALPAALGGRSTLSINGWIGICADRCARVPVVDVCDCYWDTPDRRVVNLSYSSWALISDKPLAEGLIKVDLYLDGRIPRTAGSTPLMLSTEPRPPQSNRAVRWLEFDAYRAVPEQARLRPAE